MNKHSTIFVGLDLGDKFSYLTIVDQDGELIEESRLPASRASFHRRFSTLQPCKIGLEVGAHSRWTSHLLRELGHNALVANARKLRAIYHNPRKGDRADAETLARLARLDPELLSPIHHRSPQAQAYLAVLRSRDAIVRCRTVLINHAGDIVKVSGSRLPSCSADSFAHKVAPDVPEPLRPALAPILDTIASLTQQIKSYDQKTEALCTQRYPETKLLRRISRVGPLTSLAFVLTLEKPQRFRRSREVGPAIGLVPRRDQSGDHDPQLRITKTGNPYLRRLLVSSAQYMLGLFGPDCDLRRWGLNLADRGGKNAKKRAVVAVARKLAVLLHRLWKTGEIYDPFYLARKHSQVPEALPAAA
ncbi:MAG: IS110 family transposase [Anaerolineales bacterium]|nr:IS110 family transposase [Anaerolineales bacterium]